MFLSSRVNSRALFPKSFKEEFFGFGVDECGDDDYEFCLEAEIFFYILKQIFVGERRNPSGIFEAHKARFFEKVAQALAFGFAFFGEVQKDDSPKPVPIGRNQGVWRGELKCVYLAFAGLCELGIAFTSRAVYLRKSCVYEVFKRSGERI